MKNHVINPVTGRPVAVGGRIWKDLIRDGYLQENQQQRQIQSKTKRYKVKETNYDDYNQDDYQDNETYEKNEPVTSVKNYNKIKPKKKIGKRKKNLPENQFVDYTAKCATNVLRNKLENLDYNLDDDEIKDQLQEMILQEMINQSQSQKLSKYQEYDSDEDIE